MAAILGLDFADVAAVAKEAAQGDVCQAANDNSSGQVVISGHKAAVDRACELAKAKGAKRAILLPVSAPFHCALMQPAADAMAEALASVTMHAPAVPLIANVLAGPISDINEIRKRLVEQVTGTVRWRECVGFMAGQGVNLFCEVGTGKVLTGLLKKNAPEAQGLALGTPDDIAAAAAVLKQG
jgi:[acyl-carrier-protein] S-malonyltransferase